jgi:hypothetical protein
MTILQCLTLRVVLTMYSYLYSSIKQQHTDTTEEPIDITSGVYGGGFIAAVDDTSYPNAAGAGAAMHFNSRTYANNGPLTNRYLFSWGSWLTTHMAMTAGGNLLIGKTSDSGEKLQINGNAHISGNLDVDGTITGYAPSSHTHVIADITSLQSTLDGKQAQGLLDRNGLITTNDWNSFYTDDTLRVASAHNFTAGSNNAPDNSYNLKNKHHDRN